MVDPDPDRIRVFQKVGSGSRPNDPDPDHLQKMFTKIVLQTCEILTGYEEQLQYISYCFLSLTKMKRKKILIYTVDGQSEDLYFYNPLAKK